jgi:hypothetical protein
MTTTNPARFATLTVLAGAYRSARTLLTHTARLDAEGYTEAVLCTRVDADHLVDIFGVTDDEAAAPPTCKQCRARDPRFAK